MKKRRKYYSSEEKVTILKRHLVDKVKISDLCDEFHMQPSVFYKWQREFFENGASVFEKSNSCKDLKDRQIKELHKKLQTKNEVLSEIMEEHIKLKKSFGER